MRSFVTNKRFGRRSFMAGAAGLAGVAAAGLSRTTRAQSVRSVRFAYFGTGAELQTYSVLIDAFQQAHPEIAIEPVASLNFLPDQTTGWPQGDYMEWLNTAFVEPGPPDVFLLNYRQFGNYAARGVLEPLDPYLNASKVVQPSDFFPIALDAFRWSGFGSDGLGAIPQNVSSLVVYCNLDRFAEAGIRVPTNGWSSVEFAQAAKQLTRGRDRNGRPEVFGLVVEPTLARVAPFIWSAGGQVVDSLTQPTKLTIDSKAAKSAMTWFASLGQGDLRVTPTYEERVQLNDLDRFRSGGAAMLIQSRRVVPVLRQTRGLRWDVAPLPVLEQRADVLHSDGFCMWAGAADQEAAWSFIEFAIGPAGQKLLAETGRTVPSLRTLADSPAFLEGPAIGNLLGLSGFSLAPAHAHVYVDNVPILHRLPSSATWPGVEYAFNSAFGQLFAGTTNVSTVVARTNAITSSVLASLIPPTGLEVETGE